MTYFVYSDVHLTHSTSDKNLNSLISFYNYIKEEGVTAINLGDYFDYWRCNNFDVLSHCSEALAMRPIHEILLTGNHDIINTSGVPTWAKGKFRFIHGHELDVAINMEYMTLENYIAIANKLCMSGNTIGSLASVLWSFRTYAGLIYKITHEKSWDENDIQRIEDCINLHLTNYLPTDIDMSDRSYLIFGHTHRQFKCECGANPGAFPDYLTIDDNDQVKLERW